MSVYKRGKVYHYKFVYGGCRYRGTTGQLREQDARDVEATLRLKIRQQAHGIGVEAAPLSPRIQDWVEVYYDSFAKRYKRPEAKVPLINVALRFWGERPTKPTLVSPEGKYHDLRLGDIVHDPTWILRWEDWLEARGLKGQTKNHYRSLMFQMFQLALSPLYRKATGIVTNPFAGVWRDRTPGRDAILTREDRAAILAVASWHLRLAVAIALLTPKFRLANILALRWDQHVSKDYSTITVKDHKTDQTTNAPLVAYVPEQLREILREARRRDPRSKYVITYQGRPIQQLRDAVANAVRRARAVRPSLKYGRDVDGGITFHSLRHTAGTVMADSDIPPDKRRGIMGHRSIASTMKYTHLQADEPASAELLSAALPELRDLVLVKGRRPPKPAPRRGRKTA